MVSDDDQMIRGDEVDGGQMGVGWTRCERLGTPRGEPYCSGQLTGPLQYAAMHCNALQCTTMQRDTALVS